MASFVDSEREFYQKLEAKTNLVLQYEDPDLQNLALECIPIAELSEKASKRCESSEESESDKIGEDLLLIELLHWFKYIFFSWVDVPICENCQYFPVRKGDVSPTTAELHWGASTVEEYFCVKCEKDIRFPRYNNPRKLLETRRGRCGEWANCFTLLCRSLGYECRLVFDWSDHVWTEVYSNFQNRWLHCDPCENLCDAPLIYEAGWKKKLSYVIAFSKDEVQDVTWRYTSNYSEVMKRRNLCREAWLLNCITAFTESLQSTLCERRKEELLQRRIQELAEFLTPGQVTEVELMGRTSGCVAWRKERGEYNPSIMQKMHIFNLSLKEIKDKRFHIRYNCATDKYIHVSNDSLETEKFEVLTYDLDNIFRKIEHDWKMVYLARKEGNRDGHITWKFNFQDSGLTIDFVRLYCSCKKFENGVIDWDITSGTLNISLKDTGSTTVKELQGLTEFSLTAKLSGGTGPVAWQHAQLFRQALDSREFPFEILVSFC